MSCTRYTRGGCRSRLFDGIHYDFACYSIYFMLGCASFRVSVPNIGILIYDSFNSPQCRGLLSLARYKVILREMSNVKQCRRGTYYFTCALGALLRLHPLEHRSRGRFHGSPGRGAACILINVFSMNTRMPLLKAPVNPAAIRARACH